MRTFLLIALAILFLAGTVISETIEGSFIGATETTVLYNAMNPAFTTTSNPLTAIAGFFMAVWGWIQALWTMFTWDYSFLTGTFALIRYFGWCVSIGMIVSIVLAVRGTGSS